MKNVVAIILAGGKGTRLFPLTQLRSKPAVPLGGKYRLIDIPVSNCINSDINKIFVVTQYNSESLNRHVNQTYRFGLFREGFVDVLAAAQTPESAHWFRGTADAVRRCMMHFLDYSPQEILVLSGDHLYRMDYRKMIHRHRESDADLTVGVIPIEAERASAFGILKMDREGSLTEFHEKPRDPAVLDDLRVDVEAWDGARRQPKEPGKDHGLSPERPVMASMGIYVFKSQALQEMLKDDDHLDFGQHVIPNALNRFRVAGFPFNGYWEDIGTIEAFYRANIDLTSLKPAFTFFHSDFPIFTHPRFLPANRIRNCRITDGCVISEGCSIFDSKISTSVIGIRSVIRNSKIQDTLMMGADYYDAQPETVPIRLGVGQGSVVKNAIIDKNARIGKGVRIENLGQVHNYDGNNYFIREGIVVIPKNAVIPDGTVI